MSSPGNQIINETQNHRDPESVELESHLPLYQAAKEGDWNKALDLIGDNRDASLLTARITISNDTALHVAAVEGHSDFVVNLVNLMTPEQLELPNIDGETALQGAVLAGNIKCVEAMMEKNPTLPHIPDRYEFIPLLNVANYASLKVQKEDMIQFRQKKRGMIDYLYKFMSNNDADPSLFSGNSGRQIICSVIGAGFHVIAQEMIEKYPNLAIEKDSRRRNPWALEMMATSDAFLRRDQLNFWDSLIYSLHFPSTTPGISSQRDMENPPESSSLHYSTRVSRWIRELAKNIAPGFKVRNKKLMHDDAVALTRCIITTMKSLLSSSEIEKHFRETMILDVATKLGAVEVVTECLKSFPCLLWVKMGSSERDMFYSAVCARQEAIFNLVYQIPGFKKKLAASVDTEGSTILHMVAWTQNESPFVSSVYCVALRLQRDLQWFKELESLVPPAHKIIRNSDKKTAQELFKEEHTSLFAEGEKWIKDTAQSCALVSALITTIVFAAAFTVPGGYYGSDDKDKNYKAGDPIFLNKNSFIVFVVANSSALFSSTSSLLSFVALLTSQYDHADFLESLPKKLMLGLLALFISIVCMMVAFCATLFIVLGSRFPVGMPIHLSILAAVPIVLFLRSHMLLFATMFRRTYGPSIFHA